MTSPGCRRRLRRRATASAGHSDTEVMLAAFQDFGVEASLRRLSGMFALGLWDRTARTLCLARDALGKKPLYVALADGALVFASELRAIRAFPGFHAKVDKGSAGADAAPRLGAGRPLHLRGRLQSCHQARC